MKRILRRAASSNDVGNRSQTITMKKSASSKPQRKLKDAIRKENKENATTMGKRMTRKDVVKPLHEKNSVALDQKNDKSSITAESKKVSPVVDTVSKQRTRRKSFDYKMSIEDESPQTKMVDPPSSTAPQKSVEVSSVTVRKRKPTKGSRPVLSPATETKTQTDQEKKLSPIVDTVPKQKTRRNLVDDKKSTKEKPQTKTVDQPSLSTAPGTSVEVSSVTIRKRKQTKATGPVLSPAMDTKSQTDKEKSSIRETLATDCPTKDVHSVHDKQKVTVAKKLTKKPVPFQTKTRSATKNSRRSNTFVSSLRGTVRQSNQPETQARKTPAKRPTVVATVTVTGSDKSTKKADTSKPVPKSKTNAKPTPITKPNADSTQFVTVRRHRKEPALKSTATKAEKSKTKESTISNVTTRRRRANSQTITNKNTKEVDTVTDIPPSKKRSQSVSRFTSEMETAAKSNVDAPPKRRKITKKQEDPKIEDKITKPQQPELLGNRSTASDSSDQSNGSVLPIYKRTGMTNNNTVESVFDFESNSQENTLNNDEEMQLLLAKMVRDKRASYVKPKAKRKKGETKTQANVTRSKQIEKIRSDLKELKEQKMIRTKASVPNDRARRIIPKAQPKPESNIKNDIKNTRDNVSAVEHQVYEVDVSESSNKSQEVLPDKQRSTAVDDIVDDIVNDIQFDVAQGEDTVSIQKLLKKPLKHKLSTTPTETPPRQLQATYTGPRKENALHQSTPVKIITSGGASPWRLNSDTSKYSSNVFSRYSECEKSPIKSGDVTKVVPETSSPTKKPRQPLAEKPVSHKVIEIEKRKSLANDLQNAFGFDDDDDNDECYAPRPSLPAVNLSFEQSPGNRSPKKPAKLVKSPGKSTEQKSKENATASKGLFKMPEVFNTIREKVQLLRNARTSVSSSVQKPKTQTKISTHFGDSSKPSTSRGSKMIVNKVKVEKPRTKEPSITETTSASYIDKDAQSLFETSWLTADDKPHRSYSRAPRRENKRQYDYKSILTDDESECGDSVVQKRTKRTKPKDNKYQDELRQFEENMNSDFMDVDNFEMIMEKSVSSSII